MIEQQFVVGSRVHCVLRWAGTGTVYKVVNESGSDIRSRLSYGVVFDNGHLHEHVSAWTMAGVQWSLLPELATAEQVAAALAHAYCQQAAQRAAEDIAKAQFAAEVERLRTDPDHRALQQGDDCHGGKIAAINIRRQLKAIFPTIRFSVRNRHYGTLDICWTDGPTVKQVDAVVGVYQGGRFNGMEDIYEHATSPWIRVFCGAKYVFTNRNHSAELIDLAIANVFGTYAGNFAGSGIVASAEGYRAGRLRSVEIPSLSSDLEQAIHIELADLAR